MRMYRIKANLKIGVCCHFIPASYRENLICETRNNTKILFWRMGKAEGLNKKSPMDMEDFLFNP